jgi:hypothetical protein
MNRFYNSVFSEKETFIVSKKTLQNILACDINSDMLSVVVEFLRPNLKAWHINDTYDITRGLSDHEETLYIELMLNRYFLLGRKSSRAQKLLLLIIFYYAYMNMDIVICDNCTNDTVAKYTKWSDSVIYVSYSANRYCLFGYRLIICPELFEYLNPPVQNQVQVQEQNPAPVQEQNPAPVQDQNPEPVQTQNPEPVQTQN